MKRNGEQWIRFGFLLLCCLIMMISTASLLSRKEAWFIDEYSSYGCANHEGGRGIDFEDGVTYTAEEVRQLALNTYSVSGDDRFRFDISLNNLSGSVHPPVFYFLLHFVCSLTPGVFSPWQGGIVNLFFGILTLVFFRKLAGAMTRSEWLAGALTLAWTCTMGLYGNIVLLRDYAAAMCGVVLTAWECLRYLQGHRRKADLIRVAAVSALSALCHYYCLIYLFFLCGTLGVILMIRKEWKPLLRLCAAEACAGAAAVIIFPAMLRRILFSSRGAEAAGNLADTNLSAFAERLSFFYRVISKNFFGNLLWIPVLLLILLAAVSLGTRKRSRLQVSDTSVLSFRAAECSLLILPACGFFLVVSKIAAYLNIRYMYPVTPVLFLSVAAALLLAGRCLPKQRAVAFCVAAVMLVTGCLSWPAGTISWLYIGQNRKIQKNLEPYRGMNAVVIWKNRNEMSVGLPQYEYFSTVTFYNTGAEELPEIPALKEGRDMIVLLGANDEEQYLEKLQQTYPGYRVKRIGIFDGQRKFCEYCFTSE